MKGCDEPSKSSEDRSGSDQFLPAPSVQSAPQLHPDGSFQHNARAENPLAIQLSLHTLDDVVRELIPFFGENCPISVVYSKSRTQIVHPAEVVRATLSTIREIPDYTPGTRSAFLLVG